MIVEKSTDGSDEVWVVQPCCGYVLKFREVFFSLFFNIRSFCFPRVLRENISCDRIGLFFFFWHFWWCCGFDVAVRIIFIWSLGWHFQVSLGSKLFPDSNTYKLFLNVCHCEELPAPMEDLDEVTFLNSISWICILFFYSELLFRVWRSATKIQIVASISRTWWIFILTLYP